MRIERMRTPTAVLFLVGLVGAPSAAQNEMVHFDFEDGDLQGRQVVRRPS